MVPSGFSARNGRWCARGGKGMVTKSYSDIPSSLKAQSTRSDRAPTQW